MTDAAAEKGTARQMATLRGPMPTADFKPLAVDAIEHRYGTGPQHAIDDA